MQGQPQIMTPEVQQLGKLMVATGPAGTSVATGMAKPTPLVSTTAQPQLKMATATAAEPLIIISIDDNEPMLTSNVTTATMSILDTAMMEEEESLRMK